MVSELVDLPAQGCWSLHDSPGFMDMLGVTGCHCSKHCHIQMQEEGKVSGLYPFFRTLEISPATYESVVLMSYGPGLHPVPGFKSITGL